MSGICGMINLDGRDIDPQILSTMANEASHRGADGIQYWSQGFVGFTHLALHTTPESKRENQPLVNNTPGIAIVADARIDDRETLIRKIRGKTQIVNHNPTDCDLIIASYLIWEMDCVEHLIGDFAFVIWDERYHRIFAVRDRTGSRGFHYRITKNTFYFSTDASQLTVTPGYERRVNTLMVAQDLIMPGYGGENISYYQDIEKLAAAEYLVLEQGNFVRKKYWQLQSDSEIRYSTDQEYAEHFLDIFRTCIKDRLRSEGPVGLLLSGGLDSSSIAAVAADELAKMPGRSSRDLKCVNWTFSTAPESNEFEFSRAVAQRSNVDYHEIDLGQYFPFYDYPTLRGCIDANEPYSSHLGSFHALAIDEIQGRSQPRVWMNGQMGDLVLGGPNPFYYSGLLKSGKWIRLLREFNQHREMYKVDLSWALYQFYFMPLWINPIKTRIHHLRKGKRIYARDWISQDLIEQTEIHKWIMEQPSSNWVNVRAKVNNISDPALEMRYRALGRYNLPVRLRSWFERTVSLFGAENWSPWDDHRLAEYILAIPQTQLAKGFNHKLILRRAMKDYLPEFVCQRREARVGPGYYQSRSLQESSGEVIKSTLARLRSEELGYIDGSKFRQRCNDFLSGKAEYEFAMWISLCLELWLKQQKL